MENASKALIIAGAILISIIIIGLGVYFVNMAQSAGRKVNLDSQAAQSHNNQFEAYFGDKKSASEVKALISLIRTNNITGNTGDEKNYIFVKFGDSESAATVQTDLNKIVSGTNGVKAGTTYTVKVMNDNAVDVDITVNSTTGAVSGTPVAGYYKSGFIQTIMIYKTPK